MAARVLGRRRHEPLAFAGEVRMVHHASEALDGNPLGDPSERELPLYLPPGRDPASLPLLLVLAGFTGRGQGYLETHPWRRGIVARYDRALAAGEARPAVLALPDAFTRLGGSQYVDSGATGRYATYVVDELLPLAREETGGAGAPVGVLGKSSGGFGALHLTMRYPGRFQAAGSISGDCAFENAFGGELLACLRGLVPHGGDPARFLEAFREDPELSGDGHAVINVLAMAACYSPNPDDPLGFDLPIDLVTGERRQDVWARWLAFDPVERAPTGADALRMLRHLHLECGLADEFHLQWGARILSRKLRALRVPHTHEEHPGGHRGIDHRVLALIDRFAALLAS